MRVIRFQLSIIAPSDNGGGYGIQRARSDTTFTLVKIAWVLMENCGINGSAQQTARHMIGECSPVSLSVSLNPATVGGEDVLVLLGAGQPGHGQKRDGIENGAKAKLKLLFG